MWTYVFENDLHLSSFRHPRKPVFHSMLEWNVASTLTIVAKYELNSMLAKEEHGCVIRGMARDFDVQYKFELHDPSSQFRGT
jgi:hypothetical protein